MEQRAKNRVFGVWPARKMGEDKNKKEGVGEKGGEGRERFQTNPLILKTPVRQRTELVIGWACQTLLTRVDQRS